MKKSLKYTLLTIPNKLQVDVKAIVEDTGVLASEYISPTKEFVALKLYPLITLSIIRPYEMDESGVRRRLNWSPNDSLPLTKYTLPVFLKEFLDIKKDMEIKELYSYIGNRLELNENLAEKITKKFKVGNNYVELTPVVISLLDDTRVEGIKLKINNEESTVLLTVNDVESLAFTLTNSQFDLIVINLFKMYKGIK